MSFNKVVFPLVAILVFLAIGSYFGAKFISKDDDVGSNSIVQSLLRGDDRKFVTINKTKVYIEVAQTPTQWQIGLSNHESLGKNEGMLFIFDKENTRPSFWMQGMKFGLDIIWINDSKVSQLHLDVPPPESGDTDGELPLYQPYDVIDYVLEVNAGFIKEKGIAVGDEVKLPASSL